jgi:hypothetical protein
MAAAMPGYTQGAAGAAGAASGQAGMGMGAGPVAGAVGQPYIVYPGTGMAVPTTPAAASAAAAQGTPVQYGWAMVPMPQATHWAAAGGAVQTGSGVAGPMADPEQQQQQQ